MMDDGSLSMGKDEKRDSTENRAGDHHLRVEVAGALRRETASIFSFHRDLLHCKSNSQHLHVQGRTMSRLRMIAVHVPSHLRYVL